MFLSVEVRIVYFNFGLNFRDFLARLPRIGILHERFGHFFVLKFWPLLIRFHIRHLPKCIFPCLTLKEEALQSPN